MTLTVITQRAPALIPALQLLLRGRALFVMWLLLCFLFPHRQQPRGSGPCTRDACCFELGNQPGADTSRLASGARSSLAQTIVWQVQPAPSVHQHLSLAFLCWLEMQHALRMCSPGSHPALNMS